MRHGFKISFLAFCLLLLSACFDGNGGGYGMDYPPTSSGDDGIFVSYHFELDSEFRCDSASEPLGYRRILKSVNSTNEIMDPCTNEKTTIARSEMSFSIVGNYVGYAGAIFSPASGFKGQLANAPLEPGAPLPPQNLPDYRPETFCVGKVLQYPINVFAAAIEDSTDYDLKVNVGYSLDMQTHHFVTQKTQVDETREYQNADAHLVAAAADSQINATLQGSQITTPLTCFFAH